MSNADSAHKSASCRGKKRRTLWRVAERSSAMASNHQRKSNMREGRYRLTWQMLDQVRGFEGRFGFG